mgnify:CR=1 FL=1
MVNINSKPWEELQFKDVQDYLSDPDSNENCFFEYKIDKVEPAKLVKEISAFANTYGGYIFLGVDDNKNIVGCTAWNEQRIHITIHNGITPTPQFDVKCFSADDKIIYVIKIEEGAMHISQIKVIYASVFLRVRVLLPNLENLTRCIISEQTSSFT